MYLMMRQKIYQMIKYHCKLQNWVILTFQKLQKKDYYILKQVLRIMQVQKCGKTCLIIRKVIYGHWDVYAMRFVHWCLLLELKIWMDYIKKY
jgi:hypothetical protein